MVLPDIQLENTEDTPAIQLQAEKGRISISGRSLPENAYSFYRPVIDWMKSYCSEFNQQTEVELNLDYFNSSSGRYLFELLTIIELESRDRRQFKIVWVAEKDDELMIEKGEELRELVDIPFEIRLV